MAALMSVETQEGPVLVTLKPHEYPVQLFADDMSMVIPHVVAFYSHTTHEARYSGSPEQETSWDRVFAATGIDTPVFSNLCDLELFSLSESSTPSETLKSLDTFGIILTARVRNTECLFQAFKMTKKIDV